MSNVHVEFEEDRNGDLVDVLYYHHSCAPENAKGWPAPEALDYPVYCSGCGERVEEMPLTEEGEKYNEIS